MAGQKPGPVRVYVGTYTQNTPHYAARSEGIYVYELDSASGSLTHVHTAPGVVNPSFLALDPPRRYLYAVNEVLDIDGRKLIFEDGSWLLIRPSGTEPKVRFYVEARSSDGCQALVDTCRRLLTEIGLVD